jgi:hypothetical protein
MVVFMVMWHIPNLIGVMTTMTDKLKRHELPSLRFDASQQHLIANSQGMVQTRSNEFETSHNFVRPRRKMADDERLQEWRGG